MSLPEQLGSRFRAEFVGLVVATVAGGLLVFLLARLLEPDAYGTLFLAISILTVVGIFSKLGIAKSAARYVAMYREDDPGQVPHILERSALVTVLTLGIVSLVLAVGHEHISELVGEAGIATLLLWGALFVAFEATTTFTRSIAQGFEDIELAATVKAIDMGGRLLFAVGFVALGYGALGALGGYIAGSLVASAIGIGVLYRRHYRPSPRAARMESGLTRRILEYNVPLTVTGVAGKVDKDVDTILVGFFLNPAAVGFYVLSKQIVEFVQMPASALGFSISPTYGKQKAASELDTAASLYEASLKYSLLLYVPAAVGIFVVAEPAVTGIFGAEFAGAVAVLQVLSVYAVLQALTKITDHPLNYLGRARERAIAKGIASTANVGLNVLLIPTVGVVGAAIATVLTHSFYVAVKLYIVATELPLDTGRIGSDLGTVCVVTGGMSVVLWLAFPYVTGLLSLAAVVGLAVATWGSLAIAVGAVDLEMVRRTVRS
ncbi:flippase [Natrialbaceae archaeon AArc-T1-2]|uniref:flippase n=1 Tax=Natrialbaceae archaeon AArc-T1-2 TaxID=3053904 RepID=UPI00255ACF0D|nr:flippase [Natrialbaceae archaeon AArc-T1-2]WIV67493.1 flippase [Natrialbaceae archaeon AArc-T1-2]